LDIFLSNPVSSKFASFRLLEGRFQEFAHALIKKCPRRNKPNAARTKANIMTRRVANSKMSPPGSKNVDEFLPRTWVRSVRHTRYTGAGKLAGLCCLDLSLKARHKLLNRLGNLDRQKNSDPVVSGSSADHQLKSTIK
jgi:hypothetical protein